MLLCVIRITHDPERGVIESITHLWRWDITPLSRRNHIDITTAPDRWGVLLPFFEVLLQKRMLGVVGGNGLVQRATVEHGSN